MNDMKNVQVVKHKLVEIYDSNKKLEMESRLSGSKAKLLINRCKEALKIIKNEFPDQSYSYESLEKHIKDLEDSLARSHEILTINYNLDARIDIHHVIREYNLYRINVGWTFASKNNKNSNYHFFKNLTELPLCKLKYDYQSKAEPKFGVNKESACKTCWKLKEIQA